MTEPTADHGALQALLSRRQILSTAGTAGLGALIASALPLVDGVARARAAGPVAAADLDLGLSAGTPNLADASLQAFADTMLPGRRVARTESGQPIDPRAISGADPRPGAVEADALALFHNSEVGFDALEPAFLADLDARSVVHGNPFLMLGFAARVQVCLSGLDFSNPSFLIWEAAAAVPFTAFCAAALVVDATARDACGYRVMGLPGVAPRGYRGYSWRRVLSRERTRTGSLP